MKTLRAILLASCAVTAGLATLAPRPAHAVLPVIDAASLAELVQEARTGLQMLDTLGQSLGVARQDLAQLTTFYQSMAQLTNVNQLAPTLLQQSVQNPLPQVAQIEATLRGEGVGFTGNLAGSTQTLLAKMQVYKPGGSDFAATQMNNNALAAAGQMAAAQQLYSASTQRIRGLQQLQAGLGSAHDPKQAFDLQVRAQIESGLAQAQANQGAAMAVAQQAQIQAQQQAQDQAWRQGVDGLMSQARALAASSAPGR